VVNDDGNVLVIQRRDNGHWEPPGVLELGESFEACYGEKCSRKQAYT